jgi:hypothetical protein
MKRNLVVLAAAALLAGMVGTDVWPLDAADSQAATWVVDLARH